MNQPICPICQARGIMALLDGLTCAMNHGESSASWACRKGIAVLEELDGFKKTK